MKLKNLLLSTVLVAALPAQAVVISPVSLNGNSYSSVYSAEGLLALDIDFSNTAPLLFDLSFSTGEIAAGSVTFNSVIRNFIAGGIPSLLLDFGGLSVIAGTVQSDWLDGPAGAWNVSQNGGKFSIGNGAAPNEYFGLLAGDPFATGSPLSDWRINTSGLNAGTSYGLKVQAVPEPGELAMVVAGLGMLVIMRRRPRA